jgi:GNAT superfamily N-acetyltransferase
VRAATVADLDTVLRHRHAMFAELGYSEESRAAMDVEARAYLARAFEDRTYHHWFIDGVDGVAAGAGVSVNPFCPGPRYPRPRRAWILNVYTEPEFRRRGMAGRLVEAAIEWCRAEGIRAVYLHASDQGRRVYERMGFVSSNEMRLELEPDGLDERRRLVAASKPGLSRHRRP